jgi:hypothetical protein
MTASMIRNWRTQKFPGNDDSKMENIEAFDNLLFLVK